MSSPHKVTRLLEEWSKGDRQALDALIPLVHDELHRLAQGYLSRERPGLTLQATALVNEAYLRLVGEREMQWQSRAHFIGVAAQLMRFILVDHCRRKRFQKRGGDAERVPFDEGLQVTLERREELMSLDEALTKLANQDERKSRIAELRYFGGLSVEETAEVLALSEATIVREWRLTRAWLKKELS
jgi:RNA polymerase sigma factor (TIGR02999 family)